MLSGAVVEAQPPAYFFTAVLRLQNDLIYTRDLSDFRRDSTGVFRPITGPGGQCLCRAA